MKIIIPSIILVLVLLDVALSYRLNHFKIYAKIKRKEEAENVELFAYQQFANKKMKIGICQICNRFLLMAAWVINSMYFMAVVCFLLAFSYSVQIYFGFHEVINFHKLKQEFTLAILKQSNMDNSDDTKS